MPWCCALQVFGNSGGRTFKELVHESDTPKRPSAIKAATPASPAVAHPVGQQLPSQLAELASVLGAAKAAADHVGAIMPEVATLAQQVSIPQL